jgi:thiamine-monophosphate kinase
MDEFTLIEKYFRPLTEGRAEALNLQDDAAVLGVPPGHELVVSSDVLVAGTHFLADEKPEFIAHRALRTNLSDIAAMGADPYAYQMTIAFDKKPNEAWLKAFTSALRADQKEFKIFCSGGDTTMAKGKLTISITTFGIARRDKAVKRSGAKPGDALILTGFVGDAMIGLKILQKKLKIKSPAAIDAYRKPVPRVGVSHIIARYAHAAIDISDGLIAEAQHLSNASGCAVDINLESIKFSKTAETLLRSKKATVEELLTGGDDYELLLAVSQANVPALLKDLKGHDLKPQVIGAFTEGKPEARVLEKGRKITLKKSGFTHF